jgi:hypothetical protein
VSDSHDLREDNLVHAPHGVSAGIAIQVVPGRVRGDGLELSGR